MPFHIQYLKKSLDSSHLKESIQARILESFDAYEALATPAQKAQWIQLKVQDFGIGITNENQRHISDGLFHTLDTELYTSKRPYDFGAGGKGLDLLRIKTYSQRFGFDISVGSQRCIHLPTDRDLCPGKIFLCPYCKKKEDCLSSGGSTFCISFPVTGG